MQIKNLATFLIHKNTCTIIMWLTFFMTFSFYTFDTDPWTAALIAGGSHFISIFAFFMYVDTDENEIHQFTKVKISCLPLIYLPFILAVYLMFYFIITIGSSPGLVLLFLHLPLFAVSLILYVSLSLLAPLILHLYDYISNQSKKNESKIGKK